LAEYCGIHNLGGFFTHPLRAGLTVWRYSGKVSGWVFLR
jgi:hypothetical protein